MMRTTLSWKLPATGRVLLGLGVGFAAALGCRPPGTDKPAVEAMTATPAAVTLIQEAKSRCVRVAKTGIERLRDAEEDQRRQQEAALVEHSRDNPVPQWLADNVAEETLEKYLKDEGAPELAAAERAGELIRELMPQVKQEASPEITQAVQALFTNQSEVCLRARTPKPTRNSYQQNLDYVIRDYDAAEARLQLLYTVSATDSQFALSKYKPILDQVRDSADRTEDSPMRPLTPEQLRQQRKEWEAAQELQQQQQAEHEAAVTRWRQREEGKTPLLAKVGVSPEVAARENLSPEKRQQSMQAWYARYSGRIGPVRSALADFLANRRMPDAQLMPACQALMDATAAFNGDAAIFDPPDLTAARVLKKTYSELQECARACLNGQSAESAFRLAGYQGGFAQLTSVLQPYNLAP